MKRLARPRILLIRTGGTLESEPYADPYRPPQYVETLKGNESPVLPMARILSIREKVDGFSWLGNDENRFVKDSKEFTLGDLAVLAGIIGEDDRRLFIVTHGTDAMVQNAEKLKIILGDTNRTVAFVGAMVPLSMRDRYLSDGLESLAFAIRHLHEQPPGVTVVGRDLHTKRLKFHDPDDVAKQRNVSLRDLALTFGPRADAAPGDRSR